MSGVSLLTTFTPDDVILLLTDIELSFNIVSDFVVTSVSDGRSPVSGSICFVENIETIVKRKDVIYIVPKFVRDLTCIIVDDPRYVFIKLLDILQKKKLTCNFPRDINKTVSIHPTAVIEDEVIIGDQTIISAGCVIKNGTSIGSNCIVRENTVIGCDGIALYKSKKGEVLRFPHLAGTLIGDSVEIGANCVIVRGTLESTFIGNDVVIGNLCNIGHGVALDDNVWLSVGTLIGGNSKIQAYTSIGLGVSVKDNVHIGQNTSIGMGAVVTKSTKRDSSYFGNPAKEVRKIKTGPTR